MTTRNFEDDCSVVEEPDTSHSATEWETWDGIPDVWRYDDRELDMIRQARRHAIAEHALRE